MLASTCCLTPLNKGISSYPLRKLRNVEEEISGFRADQFVAGPADFAVRRACLAQII
jgi:hypothetical protein